MKKQKGKVYIINKLKQPFSMGHGEVFEIPYKILYGPVDLNIRKLYKEFKNNSHRKDFSLKNFCNYLIRYKKCRDLQFKSHVFLRGKMDLDISY